MSWLEGFVVCELILVMSIKIHKLHNKQSIHFISNYFFVIYVVSVLNIKRLYCFQCIDFVYFHNDMKHYTSFFVFLFYCLSIKLNIMFFSTMETKTHVLGIWCDIHVLLMLNVTTRDTSHDIQKHTKTWIFGTLRCLGFRFFLILFQRVFALIV